MTPAEYLQNQLEILLAENKVWQAVCQVKSLEALTQMADTHIADTNRKILELRKKMNC